MQRVVVLNGAQTRSTGYKYEGGWETLSRDGLALACRC